MSVSCVCLFVELSQVKCKTNDLFTVLPNFINISFIEVNTLLFTFCRNNEEKLMAKECYLELSLQ